MRLPIQAKTFIQGLSGIPKFKFSIVLTSVKNCIISKSLIGNIYQLCFVNGHFDEALVSNNDDKYVQDKTLSGDGVHLSGLGHQVFIMSLKSSTSI